MTRPLRVGDRVTATGTVEKEWSDGWFDVRFTDSRDTNYVDGKCLTLIAPVEPPVGSVVVKDGAAYTAYTTGWCRYGSGTFSAWDDLSDGDVIFTPGGDADVG